ncbi:uroporphyrin-III C-methyltransferase [Pleurocapsa sp. PCC 7327]|uniref:uroporphyrinogen-III C-methyltransferase n=1 Tax=Pleurocapsa sp. PCC 7327 TaxID=118163 RepID=UPI00029FA446|nr:uroporphyrinogen-III C-methyltransferase [Pleurocapsa sp. PCC 7327]AFY78797.1 uroporphyrin-III C-methyltransferase [Pleurocapsa sp. PCC 7327]
MGDRRGKVYLVGAGLGRIDYLTLRAQQLLSRAEVLIYDALVDPQLLQLVPNDCLKLDVGKRGELSSTPQKEINQLLVDYCLQGKQVIRLKSGDPLIFGRANPEMEALQVAGCNFELVPGISSALGAPLLAGIALTDKDFSRCFVTLSAHEPELLDWEAISRIDTLVILMGGRSLGEIVQKLQENGRSPGEPIAIIRNGGRREQQVWIGTLADIVDRIAGMSLSPAVIVIGKVINLRKMTDSPSLPLAGKTVLVTRSAEQSNNFTHLLQAQGATVIEMPALEIRPPSSWEALDSAIARLCEFDWLILTSANGVEYFFKRLETTGLDARALAGIKIAVVGKKTSAILKQYGVKPDFIPPNFVADSLVENFPDAIANKKILFPRVEMGGREVLVKELTAQGAEVVEVAAYQSVCPDEIAPQAWEALQQKSVDIITFASSKTVRHFCQLIEKALGANSTVTLQELLKDICIASIGPQTSKDCYELLGRVDVEAKEFTLDGLTNAIAQWSQNVKN